MTTEVTLIIDDYRWLSQLKSSHTCVGRGEPFADFDEIYHVGVGVEFLWQSVELFYKWNVTETCIIILTTACTNVQLVSSQMLC